MALAPFKYAGGKRSLLGKIMPRLPERIGVYCEPFLGGGAVLLALLEAERVQGPAVIGDASAPVVGVWRALLHDWPALHGDLAALGDRCDRELYLERRRQLNAHPNGWRDPHMRTELAALWLWLNRTCFNGLARYNQSGGFNSPWGKRTSAGLLKMLDRLEAVHALLWRHHTRAGVLVQHSPYMATTALALAHSRGKAVTVYADPPYIPKSKTANFTNYTSGGFDLEEHGRLATLLAELGHAGHRVLLSNSSTPDSRRLIESAGLNYVRIYTKRPITKNGKRRNVRVQEVLAGLSVDLWPEPWRRRPTLWGGS